MIGVERLEDRLCCDVGPPQGIYTALLLPPVGGVLSPTWDVRVMVSPPGTVPAPLTPMELIHSSTYQMDHQAPQPAPQLNLNLPPQP